MYKLYSIVRPIIWNIVRAWCQAIGDKGRGMYENYDAAYAQSNQLLDIYLADLEQRRSSPTMILTKNQLQYFLRKRIACDHALIKKNCGAIKLAKANTIYNKMVWIDFKITKALLGSSMRIQNVEILRKMGLLQWTYGIEE